MTTYLFDGTENGLFTCIFESFYEKQNPDVVTDKSVQTGFLDETKTILTDEAKATRVLNCVKKCKTKHLYYDFTEALKSGEADKFTTIFKYLRLAITNKDSDISEAFAVCLTEMLRAAACPLVGIMLTVILTAAITAISFFPVFLIDNLLSDMPEFSVSSRPCY